MSRDGSRYIGEDPADVLDIESDAFVRVHGPVAYELMAERVGHELIVRGSLGTVMQLKCVKCGEFFSTSVQVSYFLRAYELLEGMEEVDLAPDFREEILLSLPNYPDCKGDNPRCEEIGNQGYRLGRPMDEDNRWNALNDLGLR